ncbi:MAG: hypothetical protein U5L09_21500 [Bacteroidales bacterium]|nr:hypothetical protein [Bacteroidales bacterium]
MREANEVQKKVSLLPRFKPSAIGINRLPYISKDQSIIWLPRRVRSSKAANLLILQGYPSVANLDGGFNLWKSNGLPFETHQLTVTGCGCGCGTSASGNTQEGCC